LSSETIYQLQCYEISGKLLNWIKKTFQNHTQTVKVEGARSNVKPVLSGIGHSDKLHA